MSIVRNIISGVVGVGIISAGAWALDNTKRDDNGSIVEAGELGVFNFKVGDCITDLPDSGEIYKATGVPCGDPHEYEVYAETFLESEDEEVPSNMSDQAQRFCYGEFTTFVGLTYEESTLELMSLYPSSDSWKGGDKEISCLISEASAATITASLKNAQR